MQLLMPHQRPIIFHIIIAIISLLLLVDLILVQFIFELKEGDQRAIELHPVLRLVVVFAVSASNLMVKS